MSFASIKHSEIEKEQSLFYSQLEACKLVAFAAVGVWVIGFFFPNFFVYPYFKWGGWESVSKFWPLFAWGLGLCLMEALSNGRGPFIRKSENRKLLGWELVTATLAGVWEELGFRFAFICYAMIGISIMNWFFGAGLGFLLTLACVFGSVMWWKDEKTLSVISAVTAVLTLLFALYANPVYWFYQFFVWVVHFTTLTMMDPVLYDGHAPLLIFGAVVANSWFRDGHKYQGPFGIVNAWYAGMVFLYATITYGLWTAIVVHALYDIMISVFRFFLQRTK